MKLRQWITAIVLLLLIAAAIVGLVWTRGAEIQGEEASTAAGNKPPGKKSMVVRHPLVDQRPLQTAERMATMASTPEEQALAHEAEKVGDVGSSRVDLQACKLEYSIVSPK